MLLHRKVRSDSIASSAGGDNYDLMDEVCQYAMGDGGWIVESGDIGVWEDWRNCRLAWKGGEGNPLCTHMNRGDGGEQGNDVHATNSRLPMSMVLAPQAVSCSRNLMLCFDASTTFPF